METGVYAGKGKSKTFIPQATLGAGDAVVIHALVVDTSTGSPLSNATVEIVIGGPETVALDSGLSDASDWTEATWQTQKPNKKGQGGTTPGTCMATTTNVTALGYHWDITMTSTTVTIQ